MGIVGDWERVVFSSGSNKWMKSRNALHYTYMDLFFISYFYCILSQDLMHRILAFKITCSIQKPNVEVQSADELDRNNSRQNLLPPLNVKFCGEAESAFEGVVV